MSRRPTEGTRYSYVGNDPVNFSDPEGLYRICFYNIETWSGWIGNTYHINQERLVLEGCIDFGNLGPIGSGPLDSGSTVQGGNIEIMGVSHPSNRLKAPDLVDYECSSRDTSRLGKS